MNNINHTNHTNHNIYINNGSNTNETTLTTTNTTTLVTTTATKTMTNNIGSVSSNNNNKHNTLHPNTLATTTAPYATDVNAKANEDAYAADRGAANNANAHEPDHGDSGESDDSGSAIDTDSDSDNDNDIANYDGDDDKCDKFMTKDYNKGKQKNCQIVDADREKDLSKWANKSITTETNITTSTKTCIKRLHCQQPQQQQTATTKKITGMTATLNSSQVEQSSVNEEDNTKSTSASNSGGSITNMGGNNSSGGSTGSGYATSSFVCDHNLSNNVDYTKRGASGKQLLLNITEPLAVTIVDDKLLNTRTFQKWRHSQRCLRTKALIDSLPQMLKTLASSEQSVIGCAPNSSAYGDELLASSAELLQKMSINNPFYHFRKQSTSLKEMRGQTGAERCLRKVRSDTDIFSWVLTNADDEQYCSVLRVHEHFARACALLGDMGERALLGEGAQISAPQKRGETAVQLTAADGSVVVVLDTKHNSVVSKPKSLSSLEEMLDGSIAKYGHGSRGYLLDTVATKRDFADTTNEMDSSTVITNPFSIFHEDDALMLTVNTRLRASSSASQQQRSLKKRQRSERSIRRLLDVSVDASSAKCAPASHQTKISTRQHYLNGIPASRFERQDFVSTAAAMTLKEATKSNKLKPKLIFKNLSLRKIHKSASGLPATKNPVTLNDCDAVGNLNALPQMKKLKISYPNRTQSIHSALDVSSSAQLSVGFVSPGGDNSTGKHSYFERLQAKTRHGLQKLRDKCRNFKQAAGHNQHPGPNSGFSTLAKDDSFRFIGDPARISSYESKCAALNASAGRQQATIYKSYKSEIDLSKNLHYLDAYLEENFDQQLRNTKQSANSVGRVSAGCLQRQKQLVSRDANQNNGTPQYAKTERGRAHKRSLSAAQKPTATTEQRPAPSTTANNYENLGTLQIARRGCSDSLSSSDYASVFSGPTLAVEPATPSSAGATEMVTQSLMDDASSSVGLRYEHPKMSQYFFNKLDLEGSADLLLAAEGQGSNETGTCFYNIGSVDDLVDEQGKGDAALLLDYRCTTNLDDSIRILVNEAKDTGIQQELEHHLATTKQRREVGATAGWYELQQQQQQQLSGADKRNFLLAYNENLAESHFYRSLNQHLQQQQKQRLYFDVNADVDGDEANEIGVATANGMRNDAAADGKDSHYESYLEHFYRAKSGQQTCKANSIGYNEERVGVGILDGIEDEDEAEGGYITRSAFRRAARGRKAGGSAFELRHSALLLLGEHLSKSNDRSKEAATDMISRNSRAAYYASQLYGCGDALDATKAQGADVSGAKADNIKLPATANRIAAPSPLSGHLGGKSRQHNALQATFTTADVQGLTTAERKERGESINGVNATATSLARTTAKQIDAYDSNAYFALPTGAAVFDEQRASCTHYMSTSGKDNIDAAAQVYDESAAKNYTVALTMISAATAPTNLQQQSNSNVKTSAQFPPQPRDRQQLQQHQQLSSTAAAGGALYTEGSKQAEKSMHNNDTNYGYMLDNMRRHYQQQQAHQQKSTNYVSSSLSLSTSSSSNSSISQPVPYNQQQQLILSTTTATAHATYLQPQQQKQPYQQLPFSTCHARRSSTASNASSSDNFDSFIAVRSAQTPSTELSSPIPAAALQPDYAVGTKLTSSNTSAYQHRQQMPYSTHTRAKCVTHYPTSPSSGGSSSTVPLISALNYYGTGSGGGGGGGTSSTASASASSSSSSSSTNHRFALAANASAAASNNYALLAHMQYGNKGGGAGVCSGGTAGESGCATGSSISPSYANERKPFILEYEC